MNGRTMVLFGLLAGMTGGVGVAAASTPATPHPPATRVSGPAQAIDTATLQINGQTIALSGVVGRPDDYAAQLQALIDSQGRVVACVLNGTGYTCTLKNGIDIARAGLFNGAAMLGPDASLDYRNQEQAARSAHRGIWK